VKVIDPAAVASATGCPPEVAVLTIAVIVTEPSKATCDDDGVTIMAGVGAVPFTVCVKPIVVGLKLLSPL
jgi:hypothetical protein